MRAPRTGWPSGSVTTPRTTTARAGAARKCVSNRKAASVESLRKADPRKKKAAGKRPEIADMLETPTLPPGNAVNVRGRTGLLTYAGTCGRRTGPFPSRRLAASVGGAWLHSLPAPVRRGAQVRVHSCGAVAEFHRASRTFRCGQGLWVARLPIRKIGRPQDKGVLPVLSHRVGNVKRKRFTPPISLEIGNRRRQAGRIAGSGSV